MTLRFAKPSARRVIWSIIGVALASCVISGIALAVGSSLGYTAPGPVPNGHYVRLLVLCISFWGPVLLLTAWWISLPAIVGIGALVACVHRSRSPN
jgi:hypothetical protein